MEVSYPVSVASLMKNRDARDRRAGGFHHGFETGGYLGYGRQLPADNTVFPFRGEPRQTGESEHGRRAFDFVTQLTERALVRPPGNLYEACFKAVAGVEKVRDQLCHVTA